MDRVLTIIAWMIGTPIVASTLMAWIGWRRGCAKEERLQREEQKHG
jgi:hypothetical protein